MKDIFTYLARCNQKINQEMLGILKKSLADPWAEAIPGYFFKTLGSILEHVWISDMIWMGEFYKAAQKPLDSLTDLAPMPTYGAQICHNFTDFEALRTGLDARILNFFTEMPEDLLQAQIQRKTKSGDLITRTAPKAMLHFFNHQTHHRGQISQILDAKSIENNYSNLIHYE